MAATLTTRHARTTLGLDAVLELEPATVGLGLELPDLEELLTAIGDREDVATTDARARLARGRRALELELARALAR